MNKRVSNLDGLRFFAAFVVLIVHIQGIKKAFGIKFFDCRFIENSSHIAVTFFFVLSGFLITYFLLQQKENSTISIIKFYKRRILRIWPLYYLLLVLTFFVFPHFHVFDFDAAGTPVNDHFVNKLIGCLLFFPNYTSHIYGSLSYMDITWSLAVEEFFYVTFPLFIFFIPAKNLKATFFFLLCALIALSLVTVISNYLGLPGNSLSSLVNMYVLKYRLYAFMTGALASYMFFYPDSLPAYLKFLKSRTFSSLLLGLFFICIFLGVTFSFINHQAYSVFFAVLLFSISSSGIKPFFINNGLINYFGKISYGIYMLHPVVVIVILRLLIPHAYFTNSLQGIVIIDVIAVMITIAISMLSYELFEKMFLRSSNRPARKIDDNKRASVDLSLKYTEQKSF